MPIGPASASLLGLVLFVLCVLLFGRVSSRTGSRLLAFWVLRAAIDVFACHAFCLNFDFGKTGFLFQLRGSLAKSIMAAILQNGSKIIVHSKALGDTSVYVYNDYKHVGSMANMECSYTQETSMRTRACQSARAGIGNMVRSTKLSHKSKIHYSHSFGASVLFKMLHPFPY